LCFWVIVLEEIPVTSVEGSLEWISVTAYENYDLVEDLPALLPKVLERKWGMAPFIAHYYYDKQDKLQIRFAEE
jgi:hypothetical protein